LIVRQYEQFMAQSNVQQSSQLSYRPTAGQISAEDMSATEPEQVLGGGIR
jgi:hypothetical protein